MAKQCCICNDHLGMLNKGGTLAEGRDDMPVCQNCADKLRYAKMRNISEENKMTLKFRKDAIEFFCNALKRDEMPEEVATTLEAVAGITDEDKEEAEKSAQAAEEYRKAEEERLKKLPLEKFNAMIQERIGEKGLYFDSCDDRALDVFNKIDLLKSVSCSTGVDGMAVGYGLSGDFRTQAILGMMRTVSAELQVLVRQNEQILRELRKMNGQNE